MIKLVIALIVSAIIFFKFKRNPFDFDNNDGGKR